MVLALQALSAWIGAGFVERILRGSSGSLGLLEGVGGIAQTMNRFADLLLTRSTPFRSLAVAVLILVGTGLITMILRVSKAALFARITQSTLRRIRKDVFEHLTRLDLSFTRRNRPGEIASVMIRDVDAIQEGIIDLCDRIFMQPLRLILASVMLWSLSPSLTLVFAGTLLVCGVSAHAIGSRVHRLARSSMERVAHLQGFLTEYLTTVLLARSLGRETGEKRRFDELCGKLAQADLALSVTNSLAPQLVNQFFMTAAAVILLCGGYRVLVAGTMEPGALLRFVLCLPLASYPVESLSLLYVSLRRSFASASRVFALLDEQPAAADRPDAVEPPEKFATIEFDAVAFRPDARPVLENLSFQINQGERVLVSGPSGAGKTSVLHMLAGLLRPTTGRVLIDHRDMATMRGESWRRHIGMVPQEPLMMNGTIRDNLLFAVDNARDEQLAEVLLQVRFEPDPERCRLSLDRSVGNRGEFLSGGERQRLAIARALLMRPSLLLLDEPVAHLDGMNRLRVQETIAALPRDITILFTGHDQALRELAYRTIDLDPRANMHHASKPS